MNKNRQSLYRKLGLVPGMIAITTLVAATAWAGQPAGAKRHRRTTRLLAPIVAKSPARRQSARRWTGATTVPEVLRRHVEDIRRSPRAVGQPRSRQNARHEPQHPIGQLPPALKNSRVEARGKTRKTTDAAVPGDEACRVEARDKRTAAAATGNRLADVDKDKKDKGNKGNKGAETKQPPAGRVRSPDVNKRSGLVGEEINDVKSGLLLPCRTRSLPPKTSTRRRCLQLRRATSLRSRTSASGSIARRTFARRPRRINVLPDAAKRQPVQKDVQKNAFQERLKAGDLKRLTAGETAKKLKLADQYRMYQQGRRGASAANCRSMETMPRSTTAWSARPTRVIACSTTTGGRLSSPESAGIRIGIRGSSGRGIYHCSSLLGSASDLVPAGDLRCLSRLGLLANAGVDAAAGGRLRHVGRSEAGRASAGRLRPATGGRAVRRSRPSRGEVGPALSRVVPQQRQPADRAAVQRHAVCGQRRTAGRGHGPGRRAGDGDRARRRSKASISVCRSRSMRWAATLRASRRRSSVLHVLVDANREVAETTKANNGARLAPAEILPVDPAAFELQPKAARPGEEILLAGEGFGPQPGRVLVQVNGQEMDGEILGWYDLGVRWTLPKLALAAPSEADVVVIRGDGAAANPVKITVTP